MAKYKLKPVFSTTVQLAAFSAGLLAAFVSNAAALTFNVLGVNDPQNTAEVVFNYDDLNFEIDLSITNNSTSGPDPRITGFAFNAPSEVTGFSSFIATGTADNQVWVDNAEFSPNSINTPGNHGQFDIGGLTGPIFNGGSPNAGIVVNTTASFTITLTGSNLGTLNATSFLSLFSTMDDNGTDPHYFATRFQRTGPNGGGSDVAFPVGPPRQDINPPTVPLPAALPLLAGGLGLLGLVGWRRKRRPAE